MVVRFRASMCFPLGLGLALGGCARGPSAEELRKDVTERIAQALPGDTLELSTLVRRGSQLDTKAPAGETRRILYFDAILVLKRDFEFGAWDGPGVAGLVSTLGAGPRGIIGVTSGGNQAGDVLRAHGTAVYKREEGGWTVVAEAGYAPVPAPAYATNESEAGSAAILEAMRKVIEAVQKQASPVQRKVIEQELAATHATIRARLARIENGYGIAAGPEHGQYLRFVRSASQGANARFIPLVTRGSEENIRLLREGKVSLALAQSDAALAAFEGKGSFASDGPYRTLSAVGSLYPEPLHVLVRADSTIDSIEGVKGARVAIGQPGSASRTTALLALAAHGIDAKDIQAEDLPPGDALVALEQGQVDVAVLVIGVPADSVRDAMAEVPLRLLSLSESAISALSSDGGVFPFTIHRGAYATQTQDVRTIAAAALLLAGSDLSDIEVGAAARYVYEKGRDLAAHGSAQGVQVSPSSARQGLSVPMHAAAAKVLEELK